MRPDVKKKYRIEAARVRDAQAIAAGQLIDSPLDTSAPFLSFCEACRRGDLKVCQKLLHQVNINARDAHDYTPLILVGAAPCSSPYPTV